MSYTMQDFVRDVMKREFKEMTPAERGEFLDSVPPKHRLDGLSPQQLQEIRRYVDEMLAERKSQPRKPRRKK